MPGNLGIDGTPDAHGIFNVNECRLGDLAFPCDLVELARQRSRQIEGVALLIGPLEWSGSNASSA